jgi:hypothetical protein
MALEVNQKLNREETFFRTVQRRLVETCVRLARPDTYPPEVSDSGELSVSPLAGRRVWFPRDWVSEIVNSFKRVERDEWLFAQPASFLTKFFCLESSVRTATQVVLTIWSALTSHFDLDWEQSYDDLLDSTLWYVPYCGKEQEFIPMLKYQLSYLFARGENQKDLPERPEWLLHKDGRILLGWLGRFVRTRAYGRKTQHKEWRNTILHGIKKGLPQMGPYHLAKNLDSMKKRLTKQVTTSESGLDQVSRTAREIFPSGITYDEWRGSTPYQTISDHACWEMTRADRGVLGVLRLEEEGDGPSVYLVPEQLGAMGYCPGSNLVLEVTYPGWLPTDIYRHCQRIYALQEFRGKAKIKPIFEPLKVRMISAGDYASNGLYSSLQKALWKGLQRFPQFRLTGESVSVSHVEGIRWLTKFWKLPFEKMVSGDYSAATDNMKSDASRAAIEAVSGDPITLNVLGRGLQNTLLDFSSIQTMLPTPVPDPFVMTNGQLMGCVFSFPLLCIVNCAAYRGALEEYTGKTWSISRLPVLINGDDILFMANKSFYQIWKRKIEDVGFEMSIGKNYYSRDLAVINSTYFSIKGDNVRKVPYLNMGWCTGVRKGGGGNDLDSGDHESKSVLSISSQVDRTRSDWLFDHDFPCRDRYSRRLGIVNRFRSEIRLWQWDRIRRTNVPICGGPGGLDLSDEPDETWEAFSYFIELNRDRSPSFGLSSFPRTLVPWKICKPLDGPSDNFYPLWKKFLRQGGALLREDLVSEYLDRLADAAELRIYDGRIQLGAL